MLRGAGGGGVRDPDNQHRVSARRDLAALAVRHRAAKRESTLGEPIAVRAIPETTCSILGAAAVSQSCARVTSGHPLLRRAVRRRVDEGEADRPRRTRGEHRNSSRTVTEAAHVLVRSTALLIALIEYVIVAARALGQPRLG